jgi:hypothetical protein
MAFGQGRRRGGISMGGILVIVGIVVASFKTSCSESSSRSSVLPLSGGFVRGKWY